MKSSVQELDVLANELVLGDADFEKIANIVKRETGIVLGPHKRNLVYGRLAKRLRARNLVRFADYLSVLRGPDGAFELREMMNAITTNLTSFFRESHHFEMLEKEILPRLITNCERSCDRIRLWSAACSSGEEPYSMAMTVASLAQRLRNLDVKILATDIDTQMVSTALNGVYEAHKAESIPVKWRHRFCEPCGEGLVEMSEELKSLISFRELNLFDPWPMKGPFDVIFCRNVLIYFDKLSQEALFDRFAEYLTEGGWLIIGHSEAVPLTNKRFVRAGRTVYRRAI